MPKDKTEIFENPSEDELPTAELKDEPSKLPPKKPRKKRILTDEQRAKAIENLKKGRLTAQANRERKKKLKQIEKEEKRKQEDKKISEFESKKKAPKKDPEPEPPMPKEPKGKSSEDYENEIKALREQLAEKSKPKEKPKEKKPLSPVKEIDEPEMLVDMQSIKSAPAPAPMPTAPKKKRRACGIRGLTTLRGLGMYP
jgi:hypothetical protein